MFTSWQQHPAPSVCSSKHFHLAHFWSSCLISLWRQKSFKPHCILRQHIYWGLAFQYLREINTAPWFMNPCHPPTGLVRGPSYSTLLLPHPTMGFRYQKEHTNTHPSFTGELGLKAVLTVTVHRWSIRMSLKREKKENTELARVNLPVLSNLTMFKKHVNLSRIIKDVSSYFKSTTAAWSSSQKICDTHLLFWHPTISLASLVVCVWGSWMAARLSDSPVFVYPE